MRLLAEMLDQLTLTNNETAKSYGLNSPLTGFYLVNCHVSFIKNDDKILYLACPEDNCRRKVVEESPNLFKCENCNR